MNHKVRDSMHFFYDYRLVARLMLDFDSPNATTALLVLRTESLWEDWRQANAWLGDDSMDARTTTSSSWLLKLSSNTSGMRVRDTSQKRLVVDKTLNEGGRRRLCQALADEYRVYRWLIQQAVNLSNQQKLKTMERARASCPHVDWRYNRSTNRKERLP
jgi:hypothetical protein